MSKLSKDLTSISGVLPMHPRENLFLVSTIASVSAGTAINADGCASFTLSLTGTFVGTVLVEGTPDGSNWYTMPMKPINVASTLLVVSATAVGQFTGINPGFTQVRLRCSAYTSGTVSYALINSLAPNAQFYSGIGPNSIGTVTAATGVAATLTIASPGAGLRHYLTNLRIERHTSAALTAGATPTVITTTNLPGSLAYSIPADAAAQGVVYVLNENWGTPGLASSAQATATTIVAGVVTGVIWRITAAYYVAP